MYKNFKKLETLIKVVDPRKLDLMQKLIILFSKIAILLLKGSFEKKRLFSKKNI